jgi:hypothetical protein
MLRVPSILIRFSLAAGLVGLVSARGSDQDIRTEIRHPVATPYHTEDPDVAAFRLKFAIRLTNPSERPVNLPRSGTDGDEMTRAAVIAVESKQSDGAWKYVVQSTWVDDGKIKYEPCTSLPPGGTVEIENLPSGLLLLKKQLADLGGEPTVRFGLWLLCRQPDGKVVITSATTDEFGLRLPAEP